jgi:hypothetical protein
MTTKLTDALKREIDIDGAPYTLTIEPDGMTLVLKGRRKGFALRWHDLVSGDAALTTALNASLAARLTPLRSAGRAAERQEEKPATAMSKPRKRAKR